MKNASIVFVLCILLFAQLTGCKTKKVTEDWPDDYAGIYGEQPWSIQKQVGEDTFLIEDITRQYYLKKIAHTDSINNGTIDKWPAQIFSSSFFEKKDSCIVVYIDDGGHKRYCDSMAGKQFIHYHCMGLIDQANCFAIRSETEVSSEIIFVSKRSGLENRLGQFPAFSPARKRYIVCRYDLVSYSIDNGFEIGTVKDGLLNYEMEVNGDNEGAWGADKPVWVSENEIVFLRKTMNAITREEEIHYCRIVIR